MKIKSAEKTMPPVNCENCAVQQKNFEISMTHYEIMNTDFQTLKSRLFESIPNCCNRLLAYFQMKKEKVTERATGHYGRTWLDRTNDRGGKCIDVYNSVVDVYEIPPISLDMEATLERTKEYVFDEPVIVVLNKNPSCSIGFHEIIPVGWASFPVRPWTDNVGGAGYSCRRTVTIHPGPGMSASEELKKAEARLYDQQASYYNALRSRTEKLIEMETEKFIHEKVHKKGPFEEEE